LNHGSFFNASDWLEWLSVSGASYEVPIKAYFWCYARFDLVEEEMISFLTITLLIIDSQGKKLWLL